MAELYIPHTGIPASRLSNIKLGSPTIPPDTLRRVSILELAVKVNPDREVTDIWVVLPKEGLGKQLTLYEAIRLRDKLELAIKAMTGKGESRIIFEDEALKKELLSKDSLLRDE